MKASFAFPLACLSALAAVLGAPLARAADFVNGGFETGSFAGWTENGGYWYGGTNYPTDYTFTSGPYQSMIVTPDDVPCLASKGVSINEVESGSYSARINSNDSYTDGGWAGWDFSQIQQTVTNWDSPYLSFDWSAVLQDSGHDHSNRPHFRVILEDLTTATTLYNIAYYSDDLPPDMVQRTGPDSEDWTYTGWQHMQLNTPGLKGHSLSLTILASDCAQGAHDGALYVDNIMASPETDDELPVAVPVVEPERMEAGVPVVLDGTGSYDLEDYTIDLYDWDFNGDGITDLSGGATQQWTIPATWAPGSYTLNLRVRVQPPSPLPAQWSPWAPVILTVLGPPVASLSTLSPATGAIRADGQSTNVLTVQARDANTNNLTTGGQNVVISRVSGTGTINSTVDNSNGTYTAKVTAPSMLGSGTFTATMGGIPVGTDVGAQQSVIAYLPLVGPHLTAILTSTNTLVVSWPVTASSWRLQATTNLPTTETIWTDYSYQTNGATCRRIDPPPAGKRFYRLKLP